MNYAYFCVGGVIFFQLIGSSSMSSDTYARNQQQRFTKIAQELHPDLFRYAVWLSRDKGVAEDVVQEALIRAWRAFSSLRDDAAVKPWLLTIVRRENARYFERRRLELVDIDSLTDRQAAMLATGHDTDIDDLRTAIFELHDDYREPLVLQVLMGYSSAEIAELMGIKTGAVLTRLYRARQQLVDRFGESALDEIADQ